MKSDGRILRICGDYCLTLKPLLRSCAATTTEPEDFIKFALDNRYFSKIDLVNAYLQIPLSSQSKSLTTDLQIGANFADQSGLSFNSSKCMGSVFTLLRSAFSATHCNLLNIRLQIRFFRWFVLSVLRSSQILVSQWLCSSWGIYPFKFDTWGSSM